MKLEELARRSSDAARVGVARLEAPPIGGGEPRRSWMPILAGVAVTALVVGGLAVLTRDRSDRDASADTVLPTIPDVPRLGLELDGWSVTFASSFEDISDGSDRPDISYYGDADADDPFSGGDLLIVANAGADPSSSPPDQPDGETIELRGTTANVTSSSADTGLPTDARSVTWYEINADATATEIVLVSRSYDVARLIAIAEALTVDGDSVTPGDNLGLDRLATAAGTPFDVLSGSGDGYVVGYVNESSTEFAVISSRRGTLAQEATVMRWWIDSISEIEVDGRPGFLSTGDAAAPALGPMVTVTWSPVDGVVTTLTHSGSDDSLDLVALAGTAFEIDDATWADYLAATAATQAGTDEFDEIFGKGDGNLGGTEYSWVLGLQADSLCFNLRVGNEGTGSCRQRDPIDVPPGGASTIDNGFGAVVAQVVIAADPTVEQIVETQGRYTITRLEADGVSWFVAIGDTNVQPSFDVIVNGVVVDTLEAAVEAAAELEPPLAANPAAVELGVADMTIVATGDNGADLSWWLGRNGPDLCVVTDALEPTAGCSAAGDIVVFRPLATSEQELTFVIVVDAPRCVDAIGIEGSVVDSSTSAGDGQHTYEIFATPGTSEGWRLRFEVAGGVQFVDLPAVEGSAAFPAQLCDG